MSDTPRTDAVAKEIGRLGWRLRAREITLPQFAKLAQEQLDKCGNVELELNAANERINLLERACAKQNEEICQTAGKALGYPWFKDDQKNFTGATEADGVCVGEHVAETIVAELAKKHAEANERVKQLQHPQTSTSEFGGSDPLGADYYKTQLEEARERIKRLEAAGDAMDPHGDADCDCIPGDIVLCKHCHSASLNWQKAKQPIS